MVVAQLDRDYRSLGLSHRKTALFEPDALPGELEALSVLCGAEADGWADGQPDAVCRAVRDERRFLERHLSRWVPQLAHRIINAEAAAPYGLLGEAVRSLIIHDRQLLRALARELRVEEAA